MSIQRILLGLILISSAALASSDAPTAYEILEKYNFPIGLLPQGVQSYTLRSDGSFEVHLPENCEFKVRSYLLRYKKKITGNLSMGTLKNLRGVSVQILFVWFGINEVVRTGDGLLFYVGLIAATFSLDNFVECPKCRCGFDCYSQLVLDS